MLNREPLRPLLLLYEVLLCFYIIIAPINNALNDQGIQALVAYAALLLLTVGTACGWLGGAFGAEKKLGGLYIAIYVFCTVIALGSFTMLIRANGATQLLMYTQFVSLSKRVSLKRVMISFYVSVIISAGFSVHLGWISSTVSRTGALIDGSIAPAALAVLLFIKEDFERTRSYKVLKLTALLSAVIVALFGMSRSRILLIILLFALKFVVYFQKTRLSKRISWSVVAMVPVVIIVIVLIASMDVSRQLIKAIGERYEAGFEDAVRRRERMTGWEVFKLNWLTGYGWRMFYYRSLLEVRIYCNHNMYVTILARGGILLGGLMFANFALMIKYAVQKKELSALVLLGLFFALGYGNAGAFNYTICCMMIPVAIILDKDQEELGSPEQTNPTNSV